MTDIALGQSIAGSLTATDLNIGGQFYDEYNLNIDSFGQLVINIAPSATAVEPNIAAFDSATDAIDIAPSATVIEPTIALIDSTTDAIVFESNTGQLTLMATTFPGINYKVRVSSTNLGDYTISAVDGDKATSIVTNSNDDGLPAVSIPIASIDIPDPTDPTAPTVVIPDPTDPTAPAVAIPIASIDISDPTDPTEPAVALLDPTDPTAPAVALPIASIDIPDPTDLTEPTVALPIASIDISDPTDPTAPAVALPDPTDPTAPAVAIPIASIDIPDPTDPTEPAVALPDPTDPTELAVAFPDPTDPTELAVAIPDPTDPTAPAVAIPIASIDISDPTDPTAPAVALPDPTDPTAPVVAIPDPTDPTAPAVALPDPTDPTAPVVALPDPTDPTQPAVSIPTAYIDTKTNLFISSNTATAGLKINAVSQKAGSKVNEIGAFVVDDATGKIGETAPGTAGYLKAATDSAKTIFSSLNGSFFSTSTRDVELDPNKTYQFFQVQDGSIADVQQQIASGKTPTNILFSLPGSSGTSPFKITGDGLVDYQISINNDEIVLNGSLLTGIKTPTIPIGAESQGLAQGRILDLTGSTGTLKADVTTKSDAVYTNTIAFYVVEDALLGTIKTTTGAILKPGDANYASEAIKSAVLSAGKTDSKLNQDLTGGKIYAPVLIAQGTLADFASKNPTNGGDADRVHAYFNYLGANPDKLDHFRLLGNNTFGVEDMYGGGDRDFNDVVINVNIKVV